MSPGLEEVFHFTMVKGKGIAFQLGKNSNLYPEIINPECSKSSTFISALNCKTSTRFELVSLYLGPLQRHRPILILNPTSTSFTDLVQIQEVCQGVPLCAEGIARQATRQYRSMIQPCDSRTDLKGSNSSDTNQLAYLYSTCPHSISASQRC